MNTNTQTKILVLLSGCPGVGKSTIAKVIMKLLSATLVDIDDFKRIAVDPTAVTSQIDPPELRWKYYQLAFEHVCNLFYRKGIDNIVMDEVFHVHELRERLEAECKSKNIKVLWVEVQCPYEVVEKRLKKTSREGHILSTDEALKMHVEFKNIFDPFPEGKKNYVRIDNATDTYALVDELLELIQKIELFKTPLPS